MAWDTRIRLLIVDDSLTIRAMMEEVIGNDADIHVIGTAANGARALDMIAEFKPDVITIDLAMPGMSGLSLVDHVLDRSSAVPLIVSSHGQRREESLKRGALGFFDKAKLMRDRRKLTDLIKQVGRGETRARRCAAKVAAA